MKKEECKHENTHKETETFGTFDIEEYREIDFEICDTCGEEIN